MLGVPEPKLEVPRLGVPKPTLGDPKPRLGDPKPRLGDPKLLLGGLVLGPRATNRRIGEKGGPLPIYLQTW